MTRRLSLVLALTGLLLTDLAGLRALCGLSPSLAEAQPSPPRRDDAAAASSEQGESLARQGQEAYERGDFREAITLYRQAYELAPNPAYLYAIATSFSQLGDIYEARDHYRRYLDTNPPDRQRVEQARLLEARHAQEIKSRADYEAKLTAARRVIEGLKEENSQLEEAVESARKEQAQPPPLPPAPPKGQRKRIIGSALLLSGGAVLGMGIAYGLVAGRAESELQDLTPEQDAWNQKLFDLGEDADRNLIVLSLAGVGLIGAGVTLYTLGERQDRTQTSETPRGIAVSPLVGPAYTGIQAAGSF